MADATVLGAVGRPCRFESCYPQREAKTFDFIWRFGLFCVEETVIWEESQDIL